MKFQDKIQRIRKERGLSQEDLAERLGLSRQAIAKWEAGISYPDVDNLITLSEFFKISIDSMLKEEDQCSSSPSGKEKVITEEIANFLCYAKRKTYAGKGAETTSSRQASHDLRWSDGNYTYYDTYLGGEQFSGEEAVWNKDVPIWSMNYCGRVLGEGFSGDFLKEALFLVSEEYPFRGPRIYLNGDYSYHCIHNGDFDWFQGYEEIFHKGNKVYECYFHGGSIK
jgi:transcriptional regulator with XRE-family HTH domain